MSLESEFLKKDFYSQFGQSEWILSLLKNSGFTNGSVFEAGAHRYDLISNSRIFIEDGWSAILVEPDAENCYEWKQFVEKNGYQNKVKICNLGISYNEKGLENTLEDVNSPYDLDVLFLDIDGGEYHLLKGLELYRPKIICVEYDSSFPLSINFIPRNIQHGLQASAISFYKLMRSKNYTYIKSFHNDLVFISDEFLPNIKQDLFQNIGREAFYKNASSELYQYVFVLLDQDKDGRSPSKGIEFYFDKIEMLIENGYWDDARHFFWFLVLIMNSFAMIARMKGDQYYEEFIVALVNFKETYEDKLFP